MKNFVLVLFVNGRRAEEETHNNMLRKSRKGGEQVKKKREDGSNAGGNASERILTRVKPRPGGRTSGREGKCRRFTRVHGKGQGNKDQGKIREVGKEGFRERGRAG